MSQCGCILWRKTADYLPGNKLQMKKILISTAIMNSNEIFWGRELILQVRNYPWANSSTCPAWKTLKMAPLSTSANGEGFWGEATSTIDWCEENYTVTTYLAEFCKWRFIFLTQLLIWAWSCLRTIKTVLHHIVSKQHLFKAFVLLSCCDMLVMHANVVHVSEVFDRKVLTRSNTFVTGAFCFLV